jgi:exosortase D (VPLPA-CTERM-specific)
MVMLLSAAPLTVFMNSFRIGVIGVMVNHYGIEWAEGFTHFFEGWVIFISCVLLLFLLAIILQRMTREPKPLSEALDLDTDGLGREAARIITLRPSIALAVAVAMTALVSGIALSKPSPLTLEQERAPFMLFPRELDGRSGSFASLEPDVAATLAADDYVNVTYMGGGTEPVNLFVAYYDDQTSGTGIHAPEVCLPVGGWEIATLEQFPVDMSDTAYGAFEVNRAVIQKGTSQQLVYYFFEQRGRRMTNDFRAKMAAIWDSWVRGRRDGALVRYITPITDSGVEAADARIQELMRASLAVMPRYLPL